jgi:hypothetical protein
VRPGGQHWRALFVTAATPARQWGRAQRPILGGCECDAGFAVTQALRLLKDPLISELFFGIREFAPSDLSNRDDGRIDLDRAELPTNLRGHAVERDFGRLARVQQASFDAAQYSAYSERWREVVAA